MIQIKVRKVKKLIHFVSLHIFYFHVQIFLTKRLNIPSQICFDIYSNLLF
jgi:hypothetical protein